MLEPEVDQRMHEMALAENVLDVVVESALQANATAVKTIYLTIGAPVTWSPTCLTACSGTFRAVPWRKAPRL